MEVVQIKFLVLLVSSLLLFGSGNVIRAASNPCERTLLEASNSSHDFIGYLGRLLETRVIKEPELQTILSELESAGSLINPISEEAAQLDYDQYIHREGLQKFIDADGIDRKLLRQWLMRVLEEQGVARIEREETRVETADLHQRMVFHEIEPGSFIRTRTKTITKEKLLKRSIVDKLFGWAQRKAPRTKMITSKVEEDEVAEIPYSFAMMSTLVTQKMWAAVMHENPALFADGPETMLLDIAGKTIKMQPDNPVERVTSTGDTKSPAYQRSVLKFIRKLNKLARTDDPYIYKLISDHKKGDFYRLPTETEWEFVARDLGKANGKYHFGDNEAELVEYSWFIRNSEGSTHPVAQKKPLLINGKGFYDLHGNVWEWMQDHEGPWRVFRGGSACNFAESLTLNTRQNHDHEFPYNFIGFRLVRIGR